MVDATSIPGILFLMRGGESKYHVIMGPKELPELPPAVGLATGDLMKNHPDKLRAILAGRREGVQFIEQHTADASKILEGIYAPLPPKDVDIMMQQLVEAKFYSQGRIEMPLLQTTAHVMRVCRHARSGRGSEQDNRSILPAERLAEMSDRAGTVRDPCAA